MSRPLSGIICRTFLPRSTRAAIRSLTRAGLDFNRVVHFGEQLDEAEAEPGVGSREELVVGDSEGNARLRQEIERLTRTEA